jgi:hypothetical protein
MRYSVDHGDPERDGVSSNRPGRRAQVGGGIAVFLGVLLLLFFPSRRLGAALDLQGMARIFVVVGVLLFGVGTFARWYYPD